MADTQPLAPTDVELIALIREHRLTVTDGQSAYEPWEDLRPVLTNFSRAVLAKWGARPAPASAAEFALQALVAAGHVTQERVDQALALPGAPARPVALELPAPWGHCVSDRIFVGRLPVHARKLAEAESLRIQPLYTEQQVRELVAAPQPVAREPLTDEQIEAICVNLRDTVGCSDKTLARAIERAHGITGGQHG